MLKFIRYGVEGGPFHGGISRILRHRIKPALKGFGPFLPHNLVTEVGDLTHLLSGRKRGKEIAG